MVPQVDVKCANPPRALNRRTTLAGHVSSTHRWVEEMVRTGARQKLPPWLVGGVEQLITVFRSGSLDAPVRVLGSDQHVRFWPRRMLHEAAVHLADAELALGLSPTANPAIAEDGVDEFLDNLPHVAWVPGAAAVDGAGRTIVLQATDNGSAWHITLGTETFSWFRAETAAGADVTVSGTAVELYLFVYGRIPAPSTTGCKSLLSRWIRATSF
jgi:uncharacterized protein (TIGR03083 family)